MTRKKGRFGTLSRKKAKKLAEEEMATKVGLFEKLPDQCLTCEKAFNKMDKEQVQSWNVVVREQQEQANLYCPDCWQKAITVVEDFAKHLKEKHERTD